MELHNIRLQSTLKTPYFHQMAQFCIEKWWM